MKLLIGFILLCVFQAAWTKSIVKRDCNNYSCGSSCSTPCNNNNNCNNSPCYNNNCNSGNCNNNCNNRPCNNNNCNSSPCNSNNCNSSPCNNNNCNSSPCNERQQNVPESREEVRPILVPFPQPQQSSSGGENIVNNTNINNSTMELTFTNTINTVNNISMPISLNPSNENSITVHFNKEESSVVQEDNCCFISERKCYANDTCQMVRRKECSDICWGIFPVDSEPKPSPASTTENPTVIIYPQSTPQPRPAPTTQRPNIIIYPQPTPQPIPQPSTPRVIIIPQQPCSANPQRPIYIPNWPQYRNIYKYYQFIQQPCTRMQPQPQVPIAPIPLPVPTVPRPSCSTPGYTLIYRLRPQPSPCNPTIPFVYTSGCTPHVPQSPCSEISRIQQLNNQPLILQQALKQLGSQNNQFALGQPDIIPFQNNLNLQQFTQPLKETPQNSQQFVQSEVVPLNNAPLNLQQFSQSDIIPLQNNQLNLQQYPQPEIYPVKNAPLNLQQFSQSDIVPLQNNQLNLQQYPQPEIYPVKNAPLNLQQFSQPDIISGQNNQFGLQQLGQPEILPVQNSQLAFQPQIEQPRVFPVGNNQVVQGSNLLPYNLIKK
ncbi:unnamed protein product [Diabrotica balteata]|uniref:Uncharacterized protein n=1 Tax=Diabrotica balteata TaxID=107213 RepID=A0A9P0E3W5_DIABA|nr:unnamed protein product [Diabrotica balteata]